MELHLHAPMFLFTFTLQTQMQFYFSPFYYTLFPFRQFLNALCRAHLIDARYNFMYWVIVFENVKEDIDSSN
jgi:hypothetical protein